MACTGVFSHTYTECGGMHSFDNLNNTDVVFFASEVEELRLGSYDEDSW